MSTRGQSFRRLLSGIDEIARFCVLRGSEQIGEVELVDARIVIGRDPRVARVHLPDSDFQVSREHACVCRADDGFSIVDLDSRNRTYVNGECVPAEHPCPLQHMDVVEICDYRLRFLDSVSSAGGVGFVSEAEDALDSSVSASADLSSNSLMERSKSNAPAKLRAMTEFTRVLHGLLDQDAVVNAGLEQLLDVFPHADRALVVFVASESGELSIRGIQCRNLDDRGAAVSRTLIRHVLRSKEGVLSRDLTQQPEFSAPSIRFSKFPAVMCVPLFDREGDGFGVVQVDARTGGRFISETDLDLLSAIALQLSMAIDNTRLYAQELRREAFDRDLEQARSVQLSLLPGSPPEFHGCEFYDYYAPARLVGGDFYDYVPLPTGDLAIVLGDVSGKGLAAALVAVNITTAIRFLLKSGTAPADVLTHVGDGLVSAQHFATLVLVRMQQDSREFDLYNAGHRPPLLRDPSGRLVTVGEAGGQQPLGVVEGVKYAPAVERMPLDGPMVLFSDGLIDASRQGDDRYGPQRLWDRAASGPPSAAEFGRWIMDDVLAHSDPANQVDDITTICVAPV